MSVERYEPASAPSIPTDREWAHLERMAQMLATSGLVPDEYRGKPDSLMIAGLTLRDHGLSLSPINLHKLYVIKGKPGYMAQLQIALLARAGYDLKPVEGECDDKSATVLIQTRDKSWARVTFTMEDALKAKLPASNPTYGTYPDRMLFARAVTKAIGQHHPEILLGITTAIPAGALVETPDTPERAGKEDDQEQSPEGSEVANHRTGDGATDREAEVPDPATTVDDPLVDAAWVQRFAIAVRELAEQKADDENGISADELRAAIVYTATNGTVTSSKQLHRSQIRSAAGWFSAYRLGGARLTKRVAEDGWMLEPLPEPEMPF